MNGTHAHQDGQQLFDFDPKPQRPLTRLERWAKFHNDNPQVYAWFQHFARQAKRAGKKLGARNIGERIRWEVAIATTTDESFKVNDHYWPFYARLLALTDSDYQDFFEMRGGPSAAEIRRAISATS